MTSHPLRCNQRCAQANRRGVRLVLRQEERLESRGLNADGAVLAVKEQRVIKDQQHVRSHVADGSVAALTKFQLDGAEVHRSRHVGGRVGDAERTSVDGLAEPSSAFGWSILRDQLLKGPLQVNARGFFPHDRQHKSEERMRSVGCCCNSAERNKSNLHTRSNQSSEQASIGRSVTEAALDVTARDRSSNQASVVVLKVPHRWESARRRSEQGQTQ